MSDAEYVLRIIAGSVGLGAGIGALIGRARWKTPEVPGRSVVSWVPRQGPLLGVELRF